MLTVVFMLIRFMKKHNGLTLFEIINPIALSQNIQSVDTLINILPSN
ncbi:hypothetical protein CPARK_000086500 [cyanobacterium endosymbiont of Braarudosphaera bigelowii]|nr:hypothetical protein CPARK_000086500 [cyanobacterium endosymbiont of Braarudosphaera bigelowii]